MLLLLIYLRRDPRVEVYDGPWSRKSMKSRTFRSLFAGFLACALAVGAAMAQGNGHGHGNGKGKGHNKQQQGDDDDQGNGRYGFRSQDREVVTTYYSKHGSGLPPGLAKRNGYLPPGLEKQL